MIIPSVLGSPDYGLSHKRNGEEASQPPWSIRRVTILGYILLSILATASCVDLTEIAQFAKSSQDVGNNYKRLADDTVATCHSAAKFFPQGRTPIDCDRYVQLESELAKVNDVFFAYIASLGKVASVAPPKAAFSNVGTELQQADPQITQAQLGQAKAAGLADALSKIVLSG